MLRWLPLFVCLWACSERAVERVPVLVVAPLPGPSSQAETAREDALAALTATLTAMGHTPRVERATAGDLEALLARTNPGLAIVLDVDVLGYQVSSFEPESLTPFDDRFAIDVSRVGREDNVLDGQPGSMVVGLAAKSGLARFYAVYELARRLGARYFHPEDEWIPQVPAAELTRRALLQTVLGPGPVYTPDFTHRSWSFHGAHPLEHMESFSDSRVPIDEAQNVNDWMIKNRGDVFRGAGRGVAPAEFATERRRELDALRERRGLRRQAGITLHNQQQGASADLDPTSDEPIADQIRRVVRTKLEAAPDVYGFSIHFGPTELTTTPDLETLEWINLAGATALELRPDIQIEINDHTTGSQPVEHKDDLGCPPGTNDRGKADYYDLAFHADPRFMARVHTVMFHPLEGPARVYQQKSFEHKLCLMQRAAAEGRPLGYFPESAYWLSWDNAIPVYLPLYMWTRHRDMQLIYPLLVKNGGTLRDHRLFNSGQEWGYWQADYAVGLMHWKSDLSLPEILGEMADPLCGPEAFRDCPARTTYVEVLMGVMAEQAQAFLTTLDFRGRPGGLYVYFAGEDPADELGARSGLEFRPVRLPFREVAGLNASELQRFQAIDLAELARLQGVFTAAADDLKAVRGDVPADAVSWLDEVVDGLEIDAARAAHTLALYEVAVALRDHAPEDAAVTGPLATSESALVTAQAIITRREAAYRYPLPQLIGGGVTPETAVPNGTTYAFRVHTKTHLLSYWDNRQQQIEDLLAGRTADPTVLGLTPVFADADAPVALSWPQIDGLAGTLDMGNGQSIAVATPSHSYEEPGIFRIEGLLDTASGLVPVGGYVARTDQRATMRPGDFALVEPSSELARTVLKSLVPTLRFALDDASLALLPEPRGPGTGAFDEVVVFARIDETGGTQSIATAPLDFVLPFPDPSTGQVAAAVRVLGATFAGDALDEVTLSGQLSVQDLVDALVALAGFEAGGAAETLAGILGFDPADPPESVPFEATLTLTAD